MTMTEGARRARAWFHPGLLVAMLAAAPFAANAKTVLVIGTHPDDEVLAAAGRSRAALTAGDIVKTVVVTNGDSAGLATGYAREKDAVESALALGLAEQDVIFLGYPDGSLRRIYDQESPWAVVTSAAGRTATYGNRGLGGMDYHRYLHGVPGPYDRETALGDFVTLIRNLMPDEIYTHSDFEDHADHVATSLFVTEALATLKRQGVALHTKLYQTVIWMPGSSWPWPQLDASGWSPLAPFLPSSSPCVPGGCLDLTPVEWSRALHLAQPPEMLRTDLAGNMKAAAAPPGAWFSAFARLDEFYWLKDFGTNVAVTATATASSHDPAHPASAAIDGIIKGAPVEPRFEWVSSRELGGAWVQLDWPVPVRVAQVNVWDRPSTGDDVVASHLTFSDGTTIDVGPLPPSGRVSVVTFAPRTVSWLRFTVDAAEGTAAGLAELQVFGQPAASTTNLPPHFVWGPVPAIQNVPAGSSTVVAAVAHDLDGDPLQYRWSSDSGTIEGDGASVTFSPGPVSTTTWVTITAQALDGRGGSAENRTYVAVTPAAADGLSVTPPSLLAGDPATGAVALAAPAGPDGVEVALSSDDPSVSVPASVSVPPGASGATFPIATAAVAAGRTATVTAALPGGPRHTRVRLAPPAVATLAVSPGTVLGGTAAVGTVTLTAPAGPSGVSVSLASAAPAVARVPPAVAVPAGATSASFTVTTAEVAANVPVTLSATWGTTASGALMVTDAAHTPASPNLLANGEEIGTVGWDVMGDLAAVTKVAAAPDGTEQATRATSGGGGHALRQAVTVIPGATYTFSFFARNAGGGAAALCVFDLSKGGELVPITSYLSRLEDGAWARVGATFTVPAGTTRVAVYPLRDSSGPVSVLLWGARLEQGSEMTGGPALRATLAVAPSAVTGGEGAVGTLTLSGPAPAGGATAALSSSGAAAAVPASVTVAPGATQATFPVTTAAVSIATPVTIAAALAGSTVTAALTVEPPPPLRRVQSVSVAPTSVTGGESATGTVTLDGAAPRGGFAVALAISGGAATVPTSVVVPPGATRATFDVATTPVASASWVGVVASGGGASVRGALTVVPPGASQLVLAPAAVVSGGTSSATVRLDGPAPAGGAAVSVWTNSGAAKVPSSVTVPAGATSATFQVTTTLVTAPATATISAMSGGVVRNADLAIAALTVSRVAVSPGTVAAGASATGTVTLSSAAPAGGAAVVLWTDHGAASVPSTVTVAAGETRASFTVRTGAVWSTTTVTVTALLGATAGARLTVVAPPRVEGLAIAPGSAAGGTGATGTVTLSGPAPAGGLVVTLWSSSPAAVPARLTVPAGYTAATFAVKTAAVPWTTWAQVTASGGGATAYGGLLVTR